MTALHSKASRAVVVVAMLGIAALCLSSNLLALVVGVVTLVAVVVDVLIHRENPAAPADTDVFTVDLEQRLREAIRRGSKR